jgi:predicted dehydrogenase
MSDKVKVGIIGVGNMGSTHAANILANKINGLELTAVCDINENKLAPFYEKNVKTFSDYKELISSGLVDSVIIATPHYLHTVIAISAFKAGLNVLTEKPAGVRVSDVLKMNEAALKSGKVFGIMWNQRTNPIYRKAKELVASGKLGQLKRFVWIITNWYRTQSYYDSASWRASWKGEGGGVLLNQAPHNLDLWQWICGMPDEITANCTVGKWHDIEVEDDVTINATYKNGLSATFITSTGEYPGTNRLEISGSKGKIVLEKGKLYLYLLENDERDFCFTETNGFPKYKVDEEVFVPTETETAHNGILQNFTNAILYGEELIAPGIEGINELTLSNAAYLSSWTKKSISLPLDTKQFDSLLKEKIDVSTIKNETENKTSGQSSRWQVRW